MDGIVGEDNISKLVSAANIVEILSIVFHLEDIVIATNQDFATIQALHTLERFARNRNVAKVIDFIVCTHTPVPCLANDFIALFSTRGPRANRQPCVPILELCVTAVMTKMGITN